MICAIAADCGPNVESRILLFFIEVYAFIFFLALNLVSSPFQDGIHIPQFPAAPLSYLQASVRRSLSTRTSIPGRRAGLGR